MKLDKQMSINKLITYFADTLGIYPDKILITYSLDAESFSKNIVAACNARRWVAVIDIGNDINNNSDIRVYVFDYTNRYALHGKTAVELNKPMTPQTESAIIIDATSITENEKYAAMLEVAACSEQYLDLRNLPKSGITM